MNMSTGNEYFHSSEPLITAANVCFCDKIKPKGVKGRAWLCDVELIVQS